MAVIFEDVKAWLKVNEVTEPHNFNTSYPQMNQVRTFNLERATDFGTLHSEMKTEPVTNVHKEYVFSDTTLSRVAQELKIGLYNGRRI